MAYNAIQSSQLFRLATVTLLTFRKGFSPSQSEIDNLPLLARESAVSYLWYKEQENEESGFDIVLNLHRGAGNEPSRMHTVPSS